MFGRKKHDDPSEGDKSVAQDEATEGEKIDNWPGHTGAQDANDDQALPEEPSITPDDLSRQESAVDGDESTDDPHPDDLIPREDLSFVSDRSFDDPNDSPTPEAPPEASIWTSSPWDPGATLVKVPPRPRLPKETLLSDSEFAPGPTAPTRGPAAKGSKLAWAAGAVALALLVGLASWFANDSRQESAINQARSEALEELRAETEERYSSGGSGYNQIFQSGQAAGQGEGVQEGEIRGRAEGRGQIVEQLDDPSVSDFDPGLDGAEPSGDPLTVRRAGSTALGGFEGWSRGDFYAVRLGLGPGVLGYQVVARTQLEEDRLYRVCPDRPDRLCEVPIPSADEAPGRSEEDTPSEDQPEEQREEQAPSQPDADDLLPPDPTDPNSRPG